MPKSQFIDPKGLRKSGKIKFKDIIYLLPSLVVFSLGAYLVNNLFGLDLVYKSPSSKFNQDDIADSINIAWSQIGKVKPYNLDTFENIMNNFYDLITAEK